MISSYTGTRRLSFRPPPERSISNPGFRESVQGDDAESLVPGLFPKEGQPLPSVELVDMDPDGVGTRVQRNRPYPGRRVQAAPYPVQFQAGTGFGTDLESISP